ncbi:hypothetical protein [Halocatena marina]|uniref:hypothetical protein n=1 Tax=Halocatena marina TaxID=2934937 RepID=UPI00200E335F|nr:hypothetical protein [Halocatena marina]
MDSRGRARRVGSSSDLVAVSGNYVRNTLSDRGGNEIYPFAEVHDGHYDLEQ